MLKEISNDSVAGERHLACFMGSFTTLLCDGGLEHPCWPARSPAVDDENGNEGVDRMSPLHESEVAHKCGIMLKRKRF
jgi:hypothetical protein